MSSHFIWYTDPNMCDPECDCCKHSGETNEEPNKRNKRCGPSSPPAQRRNLNDEPWFGIRKEKHEPLWIYKRALEILREERLLSSLNSTTK